MGSALILFCVAPADIVGRAEVSSRRTCMSKRKAAKSTNNAALSDDGERWHFAPPCMRSRDERMAQRRAAADRRSRERMAPRPVTTGPQPRFLALTEPIADIPANRRILIAKLRPLIMPRLNQLGLTWEQAQFDNREQWSVQMLRNAVANPDLYHPSFIKEVFGLEADNSSSDDDSEDDSSSDEELPPSTDNKFVESTSSENNACKVVASSRNVRGCPPSPKCTAIPPGECIDGLVESLVSAVSRAPPEAATIAVTDLLDDDQVACFTVESGMWHYGHVRSEMVYWFDDTDATPVDALSMFRWQRISCAKTDNDVVRLAQALLAA